MQNDRRHFTADISNREKKSKTVNKYITSFDYGGNNGVVL